MREPKVNEVTHICCLVTGDRFYFINDPKKIVWELRYHTQIKFRGDTVKLSQCKNDCNEVQRFNANRVVVFVRRTRQFIKKRYVFTIEQLFA